MRHYLGVKRHWRTKPLLFNEYLTTSLFFSENEEKMIISEDLRKLQGKVFKQILKYKGLLKERLLAS